MNRRGDFNITSISNICIIAGTLELKQIYVLNQY